jgi:hypothetical protein
VIRRALDRWLGPAVEAGLRRLEPGVPPEAHGRLARRCLREAEDLARDDPVASVWLAGALAGADAVSGAPPAPPPLDELFSRAGAPGASAAPSLELAVLAPPAPPPGGAGLLDAEVAIVRASFEAPESSPPPAAFALVLLAGLRRGWISPAAAARAAAGLAASLEPGRWFRRAGVLPGQACCLRVLLAASPGEPGVADLAERLLRHVEVQRDGALALRGAGPGAGRLEGLRFTHALLDAAETRWDLRFLNAALKRTDAHHRALASARGRSGAGGRLLGLAYASAVARQEALLRRCL